MSLLDVKIKELIDQLDYSDAYKVKADRQSVEFVMREIVDFTLAQVVPLQNNTEIKKNIKELTK